MTLDQYSLLQIATASVLAMTFSPAQTVLQTFPLLHAYDVPSLVGDVDGDGISDLAMNRYSTGATDIFSLRTGALYLQFVPSTSGSYWIGGQAGDVDGDLRDDLIGYEPGWVPAVWSGTTGLRIRQFQAGWGISDFDDIQSDGHDEVLLGNPFETVNGMPNAGRVDIIDGATGQVVRSHLGTSASQQLFLAAPLGDMDGDGCRDYCIYDAVRMWGYSGATGAQIFTFPRLSPSYGEWMNDVGDFNADGYDDIVFRDRGAYPHTVYEEIRVLAGPSATQMLWNHVTLLQNPGPVYYYGHVGRLGDLDGDGHDDLGLVGGGPGVGSTVLAGRDLSTVWELTASTTGVPGGLSRGLEGPGDVDGNGVPDILVRGFVTPQAAFVWLVSFAQPGVAPIGAGCPSPGGSTPTIGVGVGARLGRTLTVNLSGANPNLLAAVLGVGFSDQQWNGNPLPIDLSAHGLPGCSWRIAANITQLLPTVGVNGTPHHATHQVPVPQITQLLGVNLYWQWLVLEPGPLGFAGSVTGAMRTTVVQ